MTSDEDKKWLDERERLLSTGSAVEKRLLRAGTFDAPVMGARDRLSNVLVKSAEPSPFQIALAEGFDDERPKGHGWGSRPRWLIVGGLFFSSAAAAWTLFGPRHRSPPFDTAAPFSAEPIALSKPEPAPLVDPELANCPNPVVADGSNPLIDDFEDGNARISLFEGRSGSWKVFNDRTGAQVPPHGSIWHPVLIPGGRGSSRYALHTSGGVFESWGATGGFDLATPRCYDASVYDGVTFWAKGIGRIMFSAKMTQVVAVEQGGTCRDNCYDGHRAPIDLTKRWAEYTIYWRDLAQQGFGRAVAFDARSLFEITFFVLGEDTPFNFWIDDLRFVPKNR